MINSSSKTKPFKKKRKEIIQKLSIEITVKTNIEFDREKRKLSFKQRNNIQILQIDQTM